jgi:hypothetical protein
VLSSGGFRCFIGLKGLKSLAPGFNPISASLMRGASIVEWFFVPEGQPIVSQARSAWVGAERQLRPGGTVEVVVSPGQCQLSVLVRAEPHPTVLWKPLARFGSGGASPYHFMEAVSSIRFGRSLTLPFYGSR